MVYQCKDLEGTLRELLDSSRRKLGVPLERTRLKELEEQARVLERRGASQKNMVEGIVLRTQVARGYELLNLRGLAGYALDRAAKSVRALDTEVSPTLLAFLRERAAEDHLSKNIPLDQRKKHHEDAAHCLVKAAGEYEHLGNQEKARSTFERATKLFEKTGISRMNLPLYVARIEKALFRE